MKKKSSTEIISKNFKSIVVEFPFGLGDQIMCFPLFASLKKANPEIKITALSPNKNSTLILSNNKHIDNIYEYGIKKFTHLEIFKFFIKDFVKLWSFFKDNSFDMFIVVHPNPFRSLLLKLLPYKSSLVNTENTHKTKEVVNILNKIGIKPVYDYTMEIEQQKEVLSKYNLINKKYILVNIYVQYLNRDLRQWPYFDELIAKLKLKKENIVIVGLNPVHEHRNDIIDLVNNTSLEELLVIIKNAKSIITVDGGIFHFAYSLKKSVIGIFGPLNPTNFLPFDKTLKVKVIYKNKECSPCIVNKVDIDCRNTENKYSCMKDISVDDVMKKIEEIL
ncbi:MAG: glycosyltransferase family 9 protein [Spirochaetota bacterium]